MKLVPKGEYDIKFTEEEEDAIDLVLKTVDDLRNIIIEQEDSDMIRIDCKWTTLQLSIEELDDLKDLLNLFKDVTAVYLG